MRGLDAQSPCISTEEFMAKSTRTSKADAHLTQLLRFGGAKIPSGLAAKSIPATKSLLKRTLPSRSDLGAQGAKLYGSLAGASPIDVHDPANHPALDALLQFHKKLAARKLAFPKVGPGIGGIFPGVISGTVVPPFDFADSIPTTEGHPTVSASANTNGQISASAVSSSTPGFNLGSEYARVGIYFHPMTVGTLIISASPTYSFEWSTNSLNTSFVESAGEVGLTIYGLTDLSTIGGTAGNIYTTWQNFTTGTIQLGYGFDQTRTLSASLEVTPAQVYICFVEVDALAAGVGWPGSLATAMASATVPSISYEFVPRLVNA